MIMQPSARHATRRIFDRFGVLLSIGAVVVAIIPLVAMVVYIVVQGAGAINLGFFTGSPVYGQTGGMAPMIVGTLIIIGLTSAIGIPIGLLSGMYLARQGRGRFGQTVRFVTDVVAGTPSILAGVIVYAALILPHFLGFSALAAAVALALLMFPTVTRATEAALLSVPREIHEAGLALGSPEWKLMIRVIIPTAATGIVTAIVLGIARVAGETAPLVFTAFGNTFMNTSISGPIGALPLQIWNDATNQASPTDSTAAFAGAFVLFAIILILNLIARGLTYRLSRRTRIA